MRDEITIPLREAAEEWTNPTGIQVNGRVYTITVRLQEDRNDA